MTKTALITGITGQDGSYLTELLLSKNYDVHGIIRRSSSENQQRIAHINNDRLTLHYGDMTDASDLIGILEKSRPDEVYNLAAQSHVGVSFDQPIYTGNVDGLGTTRLLEGIRTLGLSETTKFYQASTSELYGMVRETPQRETTPFYPRSPYAVAKLYAYWMVVNYREAYGLYACNGILFNHESARRGSEFVTRKISLGLARIVVGSQKVLRLGNLDSLRDWGHARDYVLMQWLMLQQELPCDYVIASGHQISVREFVNLCALKLGIALEFRGSGINEIGVVADLKEHANKHLSIGDVIIKVDPKYFRPAEVETLLGDSSLARENLGWKNTISVEELSAEMVEHDLREALREVHAQSL